MKIQLDEGQIDKVLRVTLRGFLRGAGGADDKKTRRSFSEAAG